MARIVRGGLIQASNPVPGNEPVKKIKQAMIEAGRGGAAIPPRLTGSSPPTDTRTGRSGGSTPASETT